MVPFKQPLARFDGSVFARTFVGLAVAGVLLLGGCSDDSSSIVDAGADDPVVFATPDQLVTHLVATFEQRAFTDYESALGDDFVFHFAALDQAAAGGVATWDRSTELDAVARLFSGQLGSTEGETVVPEIVPGVVSIAATLTVREDWTGDFDDGPAFADAELRALYEIDLLVTHEGDVRTEVRGLQALYASQETVESRGQPTTTYRLVAWRDYGQPERRAVSEAISLGRLKTRFDAAAAGR